MVDDYFIFRSFLCCIYFVMNRYDFCNGKKYFSKYFNNIFP